VNEESKTLVENLLEKGIKICIVNHNDLEIDTFKNILKSNELQLDFVSFDKETSELTRYYLNEVTRKIKN
jgi:hypothetical protein